jgi:hypothetical protein
MSSISRRKFFRQGVVSTSVLIAGTNLPLIAFENPLVKPSFNETDVIETESLLPQIPTPTGPNKASLDLSPAKYIWFPSERTLQNTFVLFRKTLKLKTKPTKAEGWILADSRYRLFVNGKRVQWGPAPSDPRWADADPVNITDYLIDGENVIGVQVLYYGVGEGTWPLGKPGLIFNLELSFSDNKQTIVSDSSWLTEIDRAWRPGQFKRWYLRALQEEFDARLHPFGWDQVAFDTKGWLPAMELKCPANKPPLSSSYPDYQFDFDNADPASDLRKREVPMLEESLVPVKQLAESLWILWTRSPIEYFEFNTPNAFKADRTTSAKSMSTSSWQVELKRDKAAALTFEFAEQIVGWPYFTIEAPEGTVIELMIHEGHTIGGPTLLNSHFNSWARFICKEGTNTFETFDFESLRWLQLHIHGAAGTIKISDVGVRRRRFPWLNEVKLLSSDRKLQSVINATVNTVYNSCQDTMVDGMGRERQQYSGDCGHQTHALYHGFGEQRLPKRYINTFSQGLTLEGYFLDSWPGYDRLARIMQRQLKLSKWGPILDHSIQFNFDCYNHYMYTNDLDALNEVYPRLLKFFVYLNSIVAKDQLLPVEGLGVPMVWMDHDAYTKQQHKQCSFNLYASAMAVHALAPLCKAFGDRVWEDKVVSFGKKLLTATQKKFWSNKHEIFVDNLPWIEQEKEIRLSDRTLANSLLFNQCPGQKVKQAIKALVDRPKEMGISYPANVAWRYWALAKSNKADVIIKELREEWAEMETVKKNNSLGENWNPQPDSGDLWSHCPVVPLYIMYMGIIGIEGLEPGFTKFRMQPQLGDIEELTITSYAFRGGLSFKSQGIKGKRKISIDVPAGYEGELLLDEKERVTLERLQNRKPGLNTYKLANGTSITLELKFT